MTSAAVTHLPASPLVPTFEGQVVEATEIKITGLTALDDSAAEGKVVSTDDRLRLVGEFRCVSVRHYINKDSKLVREMVIKAERAALCPWDPADPDDDGIIRARPLSP